MTERLADIGARITGIRQLGAVVNAMRGIAAARAQQARNQAAAVDRYAGAIAAAIGRALALVPSALPRPERATPARRPGHRALVLFCAEQGFAGAFSERVLDAAGAELATSEVFLVGTRGAAAIAERGLATAWAGVMPSHSPGIPKLADRIVQALAARIAKGEIEHLDVVFAQALPGHGNAVQRKRLFPLDEAALRGAADLNPPLLNLPADTLLSALAMDYLHAQLCQAALHAFAAENEARMEAMAAARNQVERQLSVLQATQRQVRQEEITAEIIELAAGERASQQNRA